MDDRAWSVIMSPVRKAFNVMQTFLSPSNQRELLKNILTQSTNEINNLHFKDPKNRELNVQAQLINECIDHPDPAQYLQAVAKLNQKENSSYTYRQTVSNSLLAHLRVQRFNTNGGC